MADHKRLVGVIYEPHTLAIRRIIIDAPNLDIHIGRGEALATGPRHEGHTLDQAFKIVERATGRKPISMAEAHRLDAIERNMGGGRSLAKMRPRPLK